MWLHDTTCITYDCMASIHFPTNFESACAYAYLNAHTPPECRHAPTFFLPCRPVKRARRSAMPADPLRKQWATQVVGLTSSQKHQGGACVAETCKTFIDISDSPTLPASSGLHPPLKRLADLLRCCQEQTETKEGICFGRGCGKIDWSEHEWTIDLKQ